MVMNAFCVERFWICRLTTRAKLGNAFESLEFFETLSVYSLKGLRDERKDCKIIAGGNSMIMLKEIQ